MLICAVEPVPEVLVALTVIVTVVREALVIWQLPVVLLAHPPPVHTHVVGELLQFAVTVTVWPPLGEGLSTVGAHVGRAPVVVELQVIVWFGAVPDTVKPVQLGLL